MRRIVEFLVPLIALGATALAARLLHSTEDTTRTLYLVPFGLAVVTGLWRPGLSGSVGAWLGWSVGVAIGWLIDAGELWLDGPAAYALFLAAVPHAAGSRIRVLLGARARYRSGSPHWLL